MTMIVIFRPESFYDWLVLHHWSWVGIHAFWKGIFIITSLKVSENAKNSHLPQHLFDFSQFWAYQTSKGDLNSLFHWKYHFEERKSISNATWPNQKPKSFVIPMEESQRVKEPKNSRKPLVQWVISIKRSFPWNTLSN